MRRHTYTAERKMSARSAVSLAIAVAGTWAIAAPAAALEPGVFVDPGSPAAKEYSVPLSVLRAAGSGRPAVEGQAQPLFGVGITPAGANSVAATSAAHGGRSAHGRHTQPVTANRESTVRQRSGAAPATRGQPVRARPVRGTVVAGIGTHHGSPAPAVALFGALVVLGGLGLGALLVAARRRLG